MIATAPRLHIVTTRRMLMKLRAIGRSEARHPMWEDVQLPVEALEPEFIQLFEYWRLKAPEGRLPGRQHIDPIELPPRLLPHILLFDVEPASEGPRFRFRVASTSLGNLLGRDVTGLCFDELGPAERVAPVCQALATCVTSGRPVFLAGRLSLPSRDYYRVKRLGLPLARDGKRVDMIIAIFLLERHPPLAAAANAADEAQQFVVL